MLTFDTGSVLIMASGMLCTDGLSEENDVMFSLQTKKAIYLTKTLYRLNCKVDNIIMPLHIVSDSCNCSGVVIFSHEEMS